MVVEIINGVDVGLRWIFFVKGEKAAIVDAGFPGQERQIIKALDKLRIPRKDVSLLIVTHGHIDHYGSAGMLKKMLSIPVVAGWPDADYMSRGESAPIQPYGPGDATGIAKATCPPVDADIIVRQDTSLKPFGIDGDILVTPGHTKGSISVAAGDGCLIGDLTLAYSVGGQPITPMNPDTYADIRGSIEKVTRGNWTYLYLSHPGPVLRRDVREQCL